MRRMYAAFDMPEANDTFAPAIRDNPWLTAAVLLAVIVILGLALFGRAAAAS